MGKQLAVIFLLLACTATLCKRNHKVRVPLRLAKVRTMFEDVVKLAGSVGDQNLPRLQATANKFHLYSQEAIYLFSKAADRSSDPDLKTGIGAVLKSCRECLYDLARSINDGAGNVGRAIKANAKNFVGLTWAAQKVFEQPDNDRHQSTLNLAAEVYNLGVFNGVALYVGVANANKSNAEIGTEIEANVEKAQTLIKNINATNEQIVTELAGAVRYLCHLSERIVQNIERWAYISHVTTPQSQELSGVSQTLWRAIGELRERASTNVTMPRLQNSLQEYLSRSSAKILKLGERTLDNGVFREILLEYLALLLSVNIWIETILPPSNS